MNLGLVAVVCVCELSTGVEVDDFPAAETEHGDITLHKQHYKILPIY